MTILHLLSQNSLTGAEVYAVTLAQKQIKNGHSVYQVSNGFFMETPAQKIPLDVETKSFLQFWSSVFSLRKLIQKKNIHVVHAHSRAASKLAFYSTWGLKVGYVSSLHGRQHISFSKKINNIYGQFQIPVCEKIGEQLIKEFRYNPRYIKTVPNGICSEDFKFKEKSPLWNQQSFAALKIAVIGRLSGPKKIRTELFIQGMTEIFKKINRPLQLTVVGGVENQLSPQSENIKIQMISYAQLNSDFLHGFDLVCGSGRVCIESLMCGIPAIAFGESLYCGLITPENFYEATKSNFGDIGDNFKLPVFNPQQAEKDIETLQGFTPQTLKRLSELAQNTYGLKHVHQRIERIYESSYFLAHYKKWIPVLMYHKIPDEELQSQHKIFVTKENFEKHLRFFKEAGFTTLTFSELSKYRKGLKSFSQFPNKPLLLTFDDGYQDNLDNADPLLKKYDFQAEIFLLANPDLKTNHWDYSEDSANSSTTNDTLKAQEKHLLVSGEKRKLWKNSAFQIGSHGLSHERLPAMTAEGKIHELTESKKLLEKEFQTEVITYAYTFGDTNADCARLAQDTGYEYALNTDTGGLVMEEDPYQIFRVNIFPHETIASLRKKTSSWYRRYYYWKRKR